MAALLPTSLGLYILSLKGLAKAEVLSYIVPGMQVATD